MRSVENPKHAPVRLTVLGSGSGGPFAGRAYTAHFLQISNHYFLLDCAEGTQMQLFRYKCRIDRIDEIFITHLHGDHIFGLPGLLMSYWLKGRTKTLRIFSPPGLENLLMPLLRYPGVPFPYAIEFVEVDPETHTRVFENKNVEVWTLPLSHRTPTCGYLFREKTKPRNLLKSAVEDLGLSILQLKAAKNGDDVTLADGRTIPNASITIDPPPCRSYAFCTDTLFNRRLASLVTGVDVLYHEATYTRAQKAEADLAHHSTAAEAATIAREASVEKLLIGHYSSRYQDLTPLLEEAQTVFPNTVLGFDGLVLKW